METALVFRRPAAVDRLAGEVDHRVVAGEIECVGRLPAVDARQGAPAGAADSGAGDALFREQGGQSAADEAGDSEDGDAWFVLHGGQHGADSRRVNRIFTACARAAFALYFGDR